MTTTGAPSIQNDANLQKQFTNLHEDSQGDSQPPFEMTQLNDAFKAAKFGITDYTLFALMLVVSMSIGIYSAVKSRNNFTVSEFLLGGRKMPAIPVALSLLGGVVSALSILGNATEIYLYGTQLSVNLLGSIVGVYIIHNFVLPIFISLNLVSVVQYLELRYHSNLLRRLASCCQLVSMFFYLGVCLYAPSIALSLVTNLPTWASVLFLGLICTFYVSIGGVRAVVYTDVVQTLLMFGGVLAVVIKVCVDLDGLQNIWDIADEGGRIEFFNFDTSPFRRHTFWTCSILGIHFILSAVGLSQAQYQRFASVKNIHQCSWLLKFFLIGLFLLWGLFYMSGLAAYAAYKDCDPLTSGRIEKPDQIIPYLVMDKMAQFPGLPGLFVAAVYGGVLSSMSSQANAIACLVWEDLLKDTRFFSTLSERGATTTVKIITVCTGLCAVGLAMAVGQMGTLFSLAYSVSGGILGPLEGLYITGIFIPWANKWGAIVGFLTSFGFSQWRVLGRAFVGRAAPQILPLSTQGCPENLLNATIIAATNIAATNIAATTPLPSADKTAGHSIYDISYCYNGVLGIIVTAFVSSIVSLVTNPTPPGSIDPLLVNPTSAKLYRKLCGFLAHVGIVKGGLEDEEEKIEKNKLELSSSLSSLKKLDDSTLPSEAKSITVAGCSNL